MDSGSGKLVSHELTIAENILWESEQSQCMNKHTTKYDVMHYFTMEHYLSLEVSSSSVNDMILKCLCRRGVIGFLPPPGGPMAHTNDMSTSLRNDPMAFLSYHPPWSIHCRTSSMGGCAPYTSRAGIFRSSMNMINLLPRGGPNIPLRLWEIATHALTEYKSCYIINTYSMFKWVGTLMCFIYTSCLVLSQWYPVSD